MSFSDLMNTADSVIMDALSDDTKALYNPVTGAPKSLSIILDSELVYDEDTGLPTAEKRTVVDFRQSDWPDTPQNGDQIMSGAIVYTVVGMGETAPPDFWRVRVK